MSTHLQELNFGRSNLVVETRRLTKRFGDRTVVDGVDLRVPGGVAFGYLGRTVPATSRYRDLSTRGGRRAGPVASASLDGRNQALALLDVCRPSGTRDLPGRRVVPFFVEAAQASADADEEESANDSFESGAVHEPDTNRRTLDPRVRPHHVLSLRR